MLEHCTPLSEIYIILQINRSAVLHVYRPTEIDNQYRVQQQQLTRQPTATTTIILLLLSIQVSFLFWFLSYTTSVGLGNGVVLSCTDLVQRSRNNITRSTTCTIIIFYCRRCSCFLCCSFYFVLYVREITVASLNTTYLSIYFFTNFTLFNRVSRGCVHETVSPT